MKKFFLFLTILSINIPLNARQVITKTRCNYQCGKMALVEGKIRVGWQYEDAQGRTIQQRSYQIVVKEQFTNRKVYDSGKVESSESQHIEIPPLPHNPYGYTWKVRIGYAHGNKRPILSDWRDRKSVV